MKVYSLHILNFLFSKFKFQFTNTKVRSIAGYRLFTLSFCGFIFLLPFKIRFSFVHKGIYSFGIIFTLGSFYLQFAFQMQLFFQ